jgi:hypothetical protein
VTEDMTVCMLRVDSKLASVRDGLLKNLVIAEQQLLETRERVDALGASTGADAAAQLERYRGVLALRSAAVLQIETQLSQWPVEPEVVTLTLNASSMAEATVVHKVFEPFERSSGSPAVTACLEAWDSKQFLQDGHYRIRLPVVSTASCTQFHDFGMDFVSVSRCMWVEGQPLYLDVGPAEYELIMAVFPGLRVADPKLHTLLTNEQARQTWHRLDTHVQFKCHYVLHHGSRITQMQHAEAQGDPAYWAPEHRKDMLQLGVQLLLPVQTCSADRFGGTYHDREENQYMLHARLYVVGEMRVHPYPREATAPRRVILCDVFEYKRENAPARPADALPAAALVEPGESAVWYH